MAVFNGSNAYFSYAANINRNTTTYTLMGWVRLDTVSAWQGILTLLADGSSYDTLEVNDSDRWDPYRDGQGLFIGSPQPAINTWYHVAIVGTSTTLTVYLNGSSIGSISRSPTTSGCTLYLGAWDVGSDLLDGKLTYARMWTGTALNATQIGAERTSPEAVITANLYGDWPLTANANDTSGNGRNLTANGTMAYDSDVPSEVVTPSTTYDLSGEIAGEPGYVADLDVSGSAVLVGTLSATLAHTAGLDVDRDLTGTVSGTFTHTADLLVTAPSGAIAETFEAVSGSWIVNIQGGVTRSSTQARNGTYSAACASTGSPSYVYDAAFSSAAGTWEETNPRYNWQRAWVYVPSATVANLGATEYIDIAGYWPTGAADEGWWLRIRQNADIYIAGFDANGNSGEVDYYATFPVDQWVEVQAGLKTQNGPGVKRAIMFLVNGDAYGYVHQGRNNTTWNRSAFGIVRTNSSDSNTVYVDDWCSASTETTPPGQDNRPAGDVYEMDFTAQSGANWQIDWSTWRNNLVMHPTYGLYTSTDRYQSGFNQDRMPSLYDDGWAEIEIDWPNGTPSLTPSGYDQPMVGMRKLISEEENWEIYPTGDGTGNVVLNLEAWVGNEVVVDSWQLPLGTANPTSRILEPGDVIRTRWQNVSATNMRVRVDFYDASTDTWYQDAIDWSGDVTAITDGSNTVNYMDDRYKASSITIDSPSYSIRRFKAGLIETYPATLNVSGTVSGTLAQSADIDLSRSLASTLSGTPAYSSGLSVTRNASGSISGEITHSAALTVQGNENLSGNLAGSVDYTADIAAARSLTSELAGDLTHSAGLSVSRNLVGSTASEIGYTSTLEAVRNLSGNVSSEPATAALLENTRSLSGSVDAILGHSAALFLEGQVSLSGEIAGDASYSSELSVGHNVSGSTSGTATYSTNLTIIRNTSGDIVGTIVHSGSLDTVRSLAGDIAGQIGYVGDLTLEEGNIDLSGSLVGTPGYTSSLDIERALIGAATGNLTYLAALSGQFLGVPVNDVTLSYHYYPSSLMVTPVDFAVISGLYESLFRVDIGRKCDNVIPRSLLRDLIGELLQAQEVTERTLGYDLRGYYGSKTFKISEVMKEYRFQLVPGVRQINVQQTRTKVDDYPVDHYLLQDMPVVTAGSYATVTFPTYLTSNPENILFEDTNNGKVIGMQKVGGYPRRQSGNWIVALDKIPTSSTVHVIDLNHIFIDVPDSENTLKPYYPGTEVEITQAKPSQELDNGNRRFWFYLWSLVDPDFEEADLRDGEFYKLIENVEFWELEEVPVVNIDQLDLELVDPYNGIIEAKLTDCSGLTLPYEFTVYYEYDPTILLDVGSISLVSDAISYLAAANLRIEDCEGCEVRTGFIREAQRPYTEVRTNTLTFEQMQIMKYGNLHGQLVYAERIASVPKYQILKKA